MNIIAFDTASGIFAVGLAVGPSEGLEADLGAPGGGLGAEAPDAGQRYYLEISGGKRHSELIMDGADILLRMAGLRKEQLGGAACMEGPGSFTGLRIGFAAAKGIALALGVPLIPVPTLDCMAASLSFWPGIILPVMDARKNAFFPALYREGKRLGECLDIGMEALVAMIKEADPSPPLLVTGPAAPLAFPGLAAAFPKTVLDPAWNRSHTAELLHFAMKPDIIKKGFDSGPIYLRKSDAELNK